MRITVLADRGPNVATPEVGALDSPVCADAASVVQGLDKRHVHSQPDRSSERNQSGGLPCGVHPNQG